MGTLNATDVYASNSVAINTTSPVATLHVNDVGSTGPAIFVENGNTSEGDFTWDSTETLQVGHWNTSTSTFSEVFQIEPSGNFIINATSVGTQSTAVSGGNVIFSVKGDIIPNIDAGNTGHSDAGDPNRRFEDMYSRDGVTSGSDEQEKNTIADSDLGLDFINRLEPKSYLWNGGTRTHYGLIAQQVETVITDLGKTSTDFAGLIKNDYVDPDDPDRQYRYGLRYLEFIGPLVKAVKELKAENDAIRARLDALEA